MGIRALHVAGYRSIRDIRLELGQLNVLTGANGCGKSNLYQSMYLLHAAARGELARTLAEEGGMPSILWAGPRQKVSKKEPVRLVLEVELEDVVYELRCGITTSPGHVTREEPSKFLLDPEVKEEELRLARNRRFVLMERDGSSAWLRDAEGHRESLPFEMNSSEALLAQIREPHKYPDLSVTAQTLWGWRFYHHFRTDADSPLRQPQVGVRSPVLDRDGQNLAAALQTIREVGNKKALEDAVGDAFAGAELEISSENTRFGLSLHVPGINRPFDLAELSDGTLRYLCLLAALLSPRPPSLLALNEPETSLHPDLLLPLARLISAASRHSQMWITTHSLPLAEALETYSGQPRIRLAREFGETMVVPA